MNVLCVFSCFHACFHAYFHVYRHTFMWDFMLSCMFVWDKNMPIKLTSRFLEARYLRSTSLGNSSSTDRWAAPPSLSFSLSLLSFSSCLLHVALVMYVSLVGTITPCEEEGVVWGVRSEEEWGRISGVRESEDDRVEWERVSGVCQNEKL